MSKSTILSVVALMTVWMCGVQVYAQSYTIEYIDFPGAERTMVDKSHSSGWCAGYYWSDSTQPRGFMRSPSGDYTTINFPESHSTYASGITDQRVVGTYFLASDPGVYLPFEYNRSTGNYRTLQATDDSYKAGASDLVDQPGVEGVVGTYETTGGEMYGWSGNPSATWPGSRLDFGLNQASVTGTGWNNWVGDYVNGDGNPRSFYAYWDSLIGDYQVLTSFGFPDWEHALFQDVTEDEIIVGYYPDHIRTNGFLYDYRNDVYTEFTIPGAEQTMIDGISKNGILTGGYVDSNGIEHGFMATPIPEPGLIIVLACSLPLLRRK